MSIAFFSWYAGHAPLAGQTNTGLTGTVTDPSGAVVSGAKLTFRNEATGVVTRFDTSTAGVYTANTLSPGVYDATVESPGFERFQQTHLIVEVGAMATDNIQLTVGESNQTVEVAATSAVELNTTDPQLDSMLPPEEVADLPIEINGNIRQISSFATLAPGVRSGEYGSVVVEGGMSNQINAASSYYNGLRMDTASAANSNPPYEMVDEFRVIRSAFSAQYGMTQGAIAYNMRTGTNKLHGDAFFIDRNSVFDSDGFFATNFNSAGKPIPPTDQETDWGGTIGGPVVLPRLYNGHDKTFFLASADIFNKTQGVTTVGTVPTPSMKQGDFSSFYNASGKLIPIYDPQTGQQFQCNGKLNVICPNRFDPLSQSLLQYIPNPNTAGTNYGLQGNMNPVVTSVPFQTQAYGVTLNHHLTQTQEIAFTWWRNHYYTVQEETAPIVAPTNPLSGEQSGYDNANIWLVNYSKTLSPSLVMTAGFAAQNKMQNYTTDNDNVNFAGVEGSKTMPYISFNGENAPTGFGNSNGELVQNYVSNVGWNLFNNWLWNKGRHTLNIGGEYHHFSSNSIANNSSGRFNFSQAETSIPDTTNPNFSTDGSSFASFLLGLVDSANRTSSTEAAFHTQSFSAYVQDDFKATKKLTLNAGLRWDVMVPYSMLTNNDVFLAPGTANPAAGGLAGAATQFGDCPDCAGFNRVNIHWTNFGPHLGFAYNPDSRTVIQAGYYIDYLGYGSAYLEGEINGTYPAVSLAGLLGGSYAVNGTGGYVPGYGQWTNPSTGAVNPLPLVSPTPFNPGLGVAQTISYLDRDKNGGAPHLQSWSFSVQRQVGWKTVVTVDYTANRDSHLTGYNINPISQPYPSVLRYGSLLTQNIGSAAAAAAGFSAPYAAFAGQFGGGATVYQTLKPFPQYSNVSRVFDQAASSHFNALQIQADRHMSNNLNFLASIELPQLYDNMTTVVNKYNQKPEWAEDTTGSFESKLAAIYQLPFGRGQHWLNSGAAATWLGGWQVSGILTYNNSQPLQITQGGEGFLNGVNRPNFNSGVKLWSGNYGQVTRYFEHKGPAPLLFSTGAWTNTGSEYVLGNANRAYNSVRGPWYPVENLSAKKAFRITDSSSFAVRVDYFNVFNRTQVPFPSTSVTASNFGLINSAFSGGNRQGQIMGTFNF
ncbi:carboxypeptidase regulatory-like domain-containing protein [Silvibacterium acidisoli]|uniref:carboxypeptidase regulatory-like domain-containing protein n=1 Tax=Acidobacteriaceae bacterium ZG23-2 TaxID=2883246 RepID=UPI00406D14A7